MVKEIKQAADSRKKLVLIKAIKKAVGIYLSENCDIYGFAYVQDTIVSDDLRKARIFVHFETKDNNNQIEILEKNKREIVEGLKCLLETKYLPKIELLEGEDENLLFYT